jgi:hypothetical protein
VAVVLTRPLTVSNLLRSAELQAAAMVTIQAASSTIAAKHAHLIEAQRELEASREATKHDLAAAAAEVSALNHRLAVLQSEVDAGAALWAEKEAIEVQLNRLVFDHENVQNDLVSMRGVEAQRDALVSQVRSALE